MCIILDNSKLGPFFSEKHNKDSAPIHDWMENRFGKLVYSFGGKFGTEMSSRAKEKLKGLDQSGKAKQIIPKELVNQERKMPKNVKFKSNDKHILALARASGASLLYTEDKSLMEDFKNIKLINNPRGRIYSRAENKSLLTNSVCKE